MVHSEAFGILCVGNSDIQNTICNKVCQKVESLHRVIVSMFIGQLSQQSCLNYLITIRISFFDCFDIIVGQIRGRYDLDSAIPTGQISNAFRYLNQRRRREKSHSSLVRYSFFEQGNIEFLHHIVNQRAIFSFYGMFLKTHM